VAVGDFNGDGLPDFVAANSVTNDLTVWLNDPLFPGTNFLPLTDPQGNPLSLFTVAPTFGVNPRKVIVGDFNGDGLSDIAVAYFGDFGVTQGNVTIFLNTGDPAHPFSNDLQFQFVRVATPNVYLLDMAAADFFGDGDLDLAVLFFDAFTGRTGISILENDGTGRLTLGPDTLF